MTDNLKNEFCVIGDPVGHSLSPKIHLKVFSILNMDFQYTKRHVTLDQLAGFIQETRALARPGFNVTIPHKENIMAFLDEIDPYAMQIGAVNTVWNNQGKLIGYNTDVHGCRVALEQSGWNPVGPVILLGAGGAARAVLTALNSMQMNTILLYDIDPGRCKLLKKHFNDLGMEIVIASHWKMIEEWIPKTSLLINASPVGMWPNVDATPFPEKSLLNETMTVFDLVPKPLYTRLLTDAENQGASTIPGLIMLVAQALVADEIWLQQRLPKNTLSDVITYMMEVL